MTIKSPDSTATDYNTQKRKRERAHAVSQLVKYAFIIV